LHNLRPSDLEILIALEQVDNFSSEHELVVIIDGRQSIHQMADNRPTVGECDWGQIVQSSHKQAQKRMAASFDSELVALVILQVVIVSPLSVDVGRFLENHAKLTIMGHFSHLHILIVQEGVLGWILLDDFSEES